VPIGTWSLSALAAKSGLLVLQTLSANVEKATSAPLILFVQVMSLLSKLMLLDIFCDLNQGEFFHVCICSCYDSVL
jgi:hypothetical protein